MGQITREKLLEILREYGSNSEDNKTYLSKTSFLTKYIWQQIEIDGGIDQDNLIVDVNYDDDYKYYQIKIIRDRDAEKKASYYSGVVIPDEEINHTTFVLDRIRFVIELFKASEYEEKMSELTDRISLHKDDFCWECDPQMNKTLLNIYEKENNIMGPMNTTNINYASLTEADIAYEQARKKIEDEYNQKALKLAKEKAHKLEELAENHRMENLKADEKRRAEAWKASYDALVEAGFTPDQAWEMTMKRFELD